MEFKVNPEIVEPIIRDQIASAVVAAMGDTNELIRRMVMQSLSQKVSSDGTVSKYSGDNKYDLIEALSGKAVRDAAKAAIEKVVQDAAPLIEAEIAAQIKRAPKKTAAAIMAGFMGLAGQPNNYRLQANFIFQPND